jgi:hypothetical protein
MLRVAIGFLLAPVLALFLRGAADVPSLEGLSIIELVTQSLSGSLPIYLFALPFGVLCFAIGWRFGKLGVVWAALAGALAVLSIFGLPTLSVLLDSKLNTWYKARVLSDLSQEVLFGALVGIVAWALAIWRNPAVFVKRSRSVPNAS